MSSMRMERLLAATASLAAMGLLASTAMAATPAATTQPTDAHGQWKVVEDFCFKCHNTEDWAGSVAFDTMSADGIPQDGKVWEAAIKKLKSGLMPPPGQKQPDKQAVAGLVTFLETTL